MRLKENIMIEKVGGNNALYTALGGLNKAMQVLDQKTTAVAEGNIDAEKLVSLQIAQQMAKIQAVNVKTAVETTEQILDILV